MRQAQAGNHCLKGTGGCERVAACPFDRRKQRWLRKHSPYGLGLGQIVVEGAGAMEVDIVYVCWCKVSILQGCLHCLQGPLAFGVWRGWMVGVTGKASTKQNR